MVEKLSKQLENAILKIFKLKIGEKCDFYKFNNCTKCDILKEIKKLEEKIEKLIKEIKEKNDRIKEFENSNCKNNESLNKSFVKDKINKLYKEIKNRLDDIKDNYLKFEKDNIKDFVFNNSDIFKSFLINLLKRITLIKLYSLMKKSYDINNNEKYESILMNIIKFLKKF